MTSSTRAAQLEGCLLNAYLYAACSLSSTPQEFAEMGRGENRRRAIQFERARAWKQSFLDVAQEEMLHLHYVQCLLRALGEPPSFALPDRNPDTGSWRIPNWRIRVGAAEPDDAGVEVPVGPLTPEAVRRFALYESSNSLQDDDPFARRSRTSSTGCMSSNSTSTSRRCCATSPTTPAGTR